MGAANKILRRKDERTIIHFDYDCFYASVFEAENPALKSVPLAVQQKQIIVTCNYEARRRGLHKLQLIVEAKKICPDVVIVLGEALDRFRNASKMLYKYLESFTWNRKVEKLGFDEVFMDVTDIIAYNQAMLNPNNLSNSFFHLSLNDPTVGFPFDASKRAGCRYPEEDSYVLPTGSDAELLIRLTLGSHFAQHLRHRLEEEKGYTSTVGISSSKLLAKLCGNLHKPRNQTTLMPPYENPVRPADNDLESVTNVTTFIDSHDIGKIPGIGFKMSHTIRNHVLSREAGFDKGLIYGATKESVLVSDVRKFPGMGPELLEKLLGIPGAERGIGGKTWALINGIDDSEVKEARKVPSQISIEDSYIRLDTFQKVQQELRMLTTSLLNRMHVDLLEDDESDQNDAVAKRWIAHPRTIRLTTRPRLPLNDDGSRTRSFNRISRSGLLPNFVFNLREGIDALVEKLVLETLIPMFRRLHPETQGWNLSLMNVAIMNMTEAASESGFGGGRDIGRMFKRQEAVLKEWKVEDKDVPPDIAVEPLELEYGSFAKAGANDEAIRIKISSCVLGSEDIWPATQNSVDDADWDEEADFEYNGDKCGACGAVMPAFAMAAHERYHALGDY